MAIPILLHLKIFLCMELCVLWAELTSYLLFLPVPALVAQLIPNGSPMAGQSFFLTCSVTGADSLFPTISYLFTQDNPEQIGIVRNRGNQNTSTLTFAPLVLSDSGQYSCDATVTSPYLSSPQNVSSGSVSLSIQSE